MKILYGVQGTGNGHISRARVMAKAMKNKGVDVDFLFSGRPAEHYFDMQEFGDYQVRKGLSFATVNGRINLLKTAQKTISRSIFKEVKQLDVRGYDLVLNDFEPVTAWAAKQQGVKSISISHQAALQYSVPKQGGSWLDEIILSHFAPVDIGLGCHWHHFGFPILPPFVEVSPSKILYGHQILVYLPFESADSIADFLTPFDDYQFYVYHSTKPIKPLPEHIQWHGFSRDGFKLHLSECGGVIANAGFELASEAIALGKKLLVKPLIGQFEQAANVAALELLAAADSMQTLDKSKLTRWLKAPSPKAIHYPQVGDKLVDWLSSGEWQQPQQLCDQLWEQVELPENWHKRQ